MRMLALGLSCADQGVQFVRRSAGVVREIVLAIDI